LPHLVVFLSPSAFTHSKGNPSAGSLNKRGFRKIRNFRPISRYILETVKDIIPWFYGTLIRSHSSPNDPSQFRRPQVSLRAKRNGPSFAGGRSYRSTNSDQVWHGKTVQGLFAPHFRVRVNWALQ